MILRPILALALCAALLAACGQPYARQEQTVDGLTIALERPERAALLKEYDLTVTLTNADGPVDGAVVSLDLTMPAMPMGQNRPLAEPLGGGRYRVRTTYTMEGDWIVTVRASVAGKEYSATFDQPVSLQ